MLNLIRLVMLLIVCLSAIRNSAASECEGGSCAARGRMRQVERFRSVQFRDDHRQRSVLRVMVRGR